VPTMSLQTLSSISPYTAASNCLARHPQYRTWPSLEVRFRAARRAGYASLNAGGLLKAQRAAGEQRRGSDAALVSEEK